MKHIRLFDNFTKGQRLLLSNNRSTYLDLYKIDKDDKTHFILLKIKGYDFHKFDFHINPYDIVITPDRDFILLLSELNDEFNSNIDINLKFDLSIDIERLNCIDLYFSLPDILRGLDIGYKIYKLMIEKFNYITSDYGITKFPKNIWYKLMVDGDVHFYTSKICSGVICKNIKEHELKNILHNIKEKVYSSYNEYFNNLIFDNYLKDKILEWKLK